jgi:hypothetical protein
VAAQLVVLSSTVSLRVVRWHDGKGVLLHLLLFAGTLPLSECQSRNRIRSATTPGASTSHLAAPSTKSISRLCTKQW